ncbi:MAG: hypothetical protein C4547_01905 [Phycisphaerales bacterium]|nr:MAG: hypothetical protein C4547_01905 [Phycisphaerales bacterium]
MSERPHAKVVYDAARTPALTGGRRAGLVLAGLLNLAVASGVFYAGWWPIEEWLSVTLLTRVPVMPAEEWAKLAQIFGAAPRPGEAPAARVAPAPDPARDSIWRRTPFPVEIHSARVRILAPVTAYGWQTLAALSLFFLAGAGGRSLGRGGGQALRRVAKPPAWVLLPVLLGWIVWVWRTKDTGFSINDGRTAIGGVALLLLLTGIASGRRTRGWNRVAAMTLILSALATGVGLWIGACCDVVTGRGAELGFMLRAMGLHGAYGVILLVATFLGRRPAVETARRPGDLGSAARPGATDSASRADAAPLTAPRGGA